jgi:hypothetical protein
MVAHDVGLFSLAGGNTGGVRDQQVALVEVTLKAMASKCDPGVNASIFLEENEDRHDQVPPHESI